MNTKMQSFLVEFKKCALVTYVASLHAHPNLRTVRYIGEDLCLFHSQELLKISHTFRRVQGYGRGGVSDREIG